MSIPHHILKEESADLAVDLLLRDAADAEASEMILEPLARDARVRLRRDGLLHECFHQSKEAHARLLGRLKRLSRLPEGAVLASQQGSIRRMIDHASVEGVFSVVPVLEGEKALLRLRGPRPGFQELGFSPAQRDGVIRLLRRRSGLILLAGPRRSGLTTSLYALLEAAVPMQRNVALIDAEVADDLQGVDQEEIDPPGGGTWAEGLRGALARGADVIGIGALRDEESAAIAVSASEHRLVLAAVEAPDASGAMTGLLDLRIAPRIAAKVLAAVLVQRLARRICPDCRRPEAWQGKPVARGAKCEKCFYTGHRGQIGLFALRDLTAPEQKKPTLAEDARAKVLEGVIAPEELRRL